MQGHAATVPEDLHHRDRRADVDTLADELVGDAVVVVVEFEVVVDVDADVDFPCGDVEAPWWQRPPRRPIELLPERAARAVEPGERSVVEPLEPGTDRVIGFGEAEEALVASGASTPVVP